MDNSVEEQNKAVEKLIVGLIKETPIPKPILAVIRKFFHYAYSIGYYKGYNAEKMKYNKHIAMLRSGNIIEIFHNVTQASTSTGISEKRIRNNITGNSRAVEGYQFRFTRSKPTLLKGE